MKITVNFNMFCDMMQDEYPNAFTYDALHLLFNWLEMLEDGGEEQEFDPGEIYGQYSETKMRQFAKDNDLTYGSYDKNEKEELTGEPPNVDELITNKPPREYENFRVVSNLLVRTEDCLGQYRIITAEDHTYSSNPQNRKTVYLVTDVDYKYRGLALNKSEASDIGELVAIRNKEEIEDEEVILDWETMDDDQVKEVVEKYLENRTCILGFTNEDTVVFQDF